MPPTLPFMFKVFIFFNAYLLLINVFPMRTVGYIWKKLSLYASKTNYVILIRKKQINLNVLPSITLNNAAHERKETDKFLGVYLVEELNWKFHITYISKGMAKFPLVIFRTYLSYFNFCITVWGNGSITALKPLFTNHKQTIRSISPTAFREHTQPIMNFLGMLNLNQIYTYMFCNYVFKALNSFNTCDWFPRYHNVHSTRSTENMTLNVQFAYS